jgi:hypothetical protein
MSVKEKVLEKEAIIRKQLEDLRNELNQNRLKFNETPNDWFYLSALSHTEKNLNEILDFFNSKNE